MQPQTTQWRCLGRFAASSSSSSRSSLPLPLRLACKQNGIASLSNRSSQQQRAVSSSARSSLLRPTIIPTAATPAPTVVATVAASFSTTANYQLIKPLPKLLEIPEEDFTEVYLKGSGPGGQKINKTNSAVQLKHIPTGIVVKCQETRSRSQNRKIARKLLATQVDVHLNGENSREAMKAMRAARKIYKKHAKAQQRHREIAEKKGLRQARAEFFKQKANTKEGASIVEDEGEDDQYEEDEECGDEDEDLVEVDNAKVDVGAKPVVNAVHHPVLTKKKPKFVFRRSG